MKIFILFLLATCLFTNAYAQKLFSVIDNTVTINMKASPLGNSDVIEATLPPKTHSYIYRISLFKKDKWATTPSLFTLLDSMGAKNVMQTTDFSKLIVPVTDNPTVTSGFIFSTANDADNFYDKKAGWRPCKNLLKLKNLCASSQQCMGKKIYFGFSNEDIDEDVDVRLEVVSVSE